MYSNLIYQSSRNKKKYGIELKQDKKNELEMHQHRGEPDFLVYDELADHHNFMCMDKYELLRTLLPKLLLHAQGSIILETLFDLACKEFNIDFKFYIYSSPEEKYQLLRTILPNVFMHSEGAQLMKYLFHLAHNEFYKELVDNYLDIYGTWDILPSRLICKVFSYLERKELRLCIPPVCSA